MGILECPLTRWSREICGTQRLAREKCFSKKKEVQGLILCMLLRRNLCRAPSNLSFKATMAGYLGGNKQLHAKQCVPHENHRLESRLILKPPERRAATWGPV